MSHLHLKKDQPPALEASSTHTSLAECPVISACKRSVTVGKAWALGQKGLFSGHVLSTDCMPCMLSTDEKTQPFPLRTPYQLQVSENGLVEAKGDLLACGNENFRGAAPGRTLELILPTHSSILA